MSDWNREPSRSACAGCLTPLSPSCSRKSNRAIDFGGSLCRSAMEEIRIAHPEISLAYTADGSLDANFDPPRMRQVLINLLANAVQHETARRASFPRRAGRQRACGWPLPIRASQFREFLPSIFDPLVRLEVANATKSQTSLGLGLFISREIVVAHGGRIDVVSLQRGHIVLCPAAGPERDICTLWLSTRARALPNSAPW